MSLEIKRINDLEYQPIEFADKDLVMDLELAVLTNAEMQVNCYLYSPTIFGIIQL